MPHAKSVPIGVALDDAPPRRPADEIAGDLRDRLTVLLNAAETLRLADAGGSPHVQAGLRMIERQVLHLGRLADELDHF